MVSGGGGDRMDSMPADHGDCIVVAGPSDDVDGLTTQQQGTERGQNGTVSGQLAHE